MTNKKSTPARDDRAGGSLFLAVLASPLGWLADGAPVALRDRAPHGDDSDSQAAQVSALVWSLALLVIAALAPVSWAAPAVVGVLVLVLPARTAARRGGELLVPTDADHGAPGRLAVTAWAVGMGRPVSYALVDRRAGDPEGLRGRRRRRLRALLAVVVPTALLALDVHLHGALSGALAPLWHMQVVLTDHLVIPLDAGLLGRLVLALVVVMALTGSTRPLGRYHAEDLALTGTALSRPGGEDGRGAGGERVRFRPRQRAPLECDRCERGRRALEAREGGGLPRAHHQRRGGRRPAEARRARAGRLALP